MGPEFSFSFNRLTPEYGIGSLFFFFFKKIWIKTNHDIFVVRNIIFIDLKLRLRVVFQTFGRSNKMRFVQLKLN
jgi:hypothetical protein